MVELVVNYVMTSRDWLNVKTQSCHIGIPIIDKDWFHDRLAFIMRIHLPGKMAFILNWAINDKCLICCVDQVGNHVKICTIANTMYNHLRIVPIVINRSLLCIFIPYLYDVLERCDIVDIYLVTFIQLLCIFYGSCMIKYADIY